MSERAKWEDYGDSAIIDLSPYDAVRVSCVAGFWYVQGFGRLWDLKKDYTLESAKRFAEDELRRILTEALARLPERT